MRRASIAMAAAGAAALLLAGGWWLAGEAEKGGRPGHAAATRTSRAATSAGSTATPPATTSSSSIPATTAAPRPPIVQQPIPYPPSRRREMAAYAQRHYGRATWRLRPRLIVLHFTASGAGSERGVHALFAGNAPNGGELPGVCAHFVVDQDGTIYQQAPLRLMCRHAIGVNDRAIGIEMVQETGPSARWADRQILGRPAQIRRVLELVRWLMGRYGIARRDVIGHAMVNDSRFFHDREGWRNDHTDWQPQEVAALRRRL